MRAIEESSRLAGTGPELRFTGRAKYPKRSKNIQMKAKLFAAVFCLASLAGISEAMDLDSLSEIGAVAGFTKSAGAVTFNCRDNSQVRVSILAPDLVRVQAAFQKPLPERDHSWAIDKTSWETPRWNLKEEADSVIIATDELEIAIRRSPLLIEFREPQTHRVINADARPMLFDANGAVAAAKKLGLDEHFYGLGEKAARLDKRRGSFVMWNDDRPGYREGTDPLYQSIPFYIGWQDGAAYGIFFDNSYRSYFDFGHTGQDYASFAADGGQLNYYFFHGPSMKKILSRYADLTGHMPLPPLWALGHQQSRYSYYPDTLAEEIVSRYRREDLPLDALHLDIHYMDGYRDFTWDPQRFPDPKGFVDKLKRQGVKVVTIVDPGIKYQPAEKKEAGNSAAPELGSHKQNYYVYEQGAKNDYFVKRSTGTAYIGKVWPGESVFVDYTLDAASRWWGDLHRAYTDYGVAGIWNDMNEPADFFDRTGAAQMSNVYYDGGEFSTHAKNRNVFALLENRATYQGLERLVPDKRPYIITRAGFAGIQRYATVWTGDNTSTWEALALSIPMLQSLGLSGEPFGGSDIGGFAGRSDGELLARWYQVSFLAPFCRNHKSISDYDQEPWRFGTYYEDIIRKYLKLRYRLLPFLYTVLEEAHRTGVAPLRPLLLNYQQDANTLNLDDQFMIGDDLLAAPVLSPGKASRLVYLPKGGWYDYWTGKKYSGGITVNVEAPLEVAPLFVRAGAIIPLWPEMNYVGEKPADPLTLRIYPDEEGRAAATLYEDDGLSPAYKNGVFRRTTVTMSNKADALQIELGAPQGSYNPGPRRLVFMVGAASPVRRVLLDGKPLSATAKDGAANWRREGKLLSVAIADDGKAHSISIR